MEEKIVFIRFCKVSGKNGSGYLVKPNKEFVIGSSEKRSDIRIHNTREPVRHVFIYKNGVVNYVSGSAPIKKEFTDNDTFELEGKTFLVQYMGSDDELPVQAMPPQRNKRFSCIPNIASDVMPPIESTKSELVPKRSRRSSTNSESSSYPPSESGESSSAPGTPVPTSRSTSRRFSMMRKHSMAPLPEEEESNSNDSKYKTPENATPAPKVVMRSHKSAIKSNLDGESTPKCVMPLSNTKTRRSLQLYKDSDAMKDSPLDSPNTSDDETSEKGRLTITTTSDSGSGLELHVSNVDTANEDVNVHGGDIDIVIKGPDTDDQNLLVEERQVFKRGRKEVDGEDDGEADHVDEPPKKRMKREERLQSFYKLRTSSDSEHNNRDSSLHSKSFPSTSQSTINTSSKSIVALAPNTVPRFRKSRQQFASSTVQSMSPKILPEIWSADENQENISFSEYADKSPSPQSRPAEFPIGDEVNGSSTTHCSSFDYVHGKDAELSSLGLSVFNIDEIGVPENAAGFDLMEFSTTCQSTPDKNAFEQSYSRGRRSSRTVKPPKVYTPDHPTIENRSSPNTTSCGNITTLINPVRRSSRPLTPISFPDYVVTPHTPRRRGRATEAFVDLLNNTAKNDDSNSKSSKQTRKYSQTPAKMAKKVLTTNSDTPKNRVPLSPRSLQKNTVVASIIELNSSFEDNTSAKKRPRTHKEPRTPRTPRPNTTFDLDDSFSEFRENNCSLTSTQKKTDLASSAVTQIKKSIMQNSTPIAAQSSKQDTNIFSNKSMQLLEQSVAVRRSNRTPKSVFRRNSLLDETIFDTSTSTKQSHSMSRSLSMGHSLSMKDDSLTAGKDASAMRPQRRSASSWKRSVSASNLKSIEKLAQAKAKKNASTITNLTKVQGIKKLMRTAKLQKGPKNDLTDVRGIRKLMKTPKSVKEPINDLSDLRGVKNMLQTPKVMAGPKNDLTNIAGVKQLMRTPKEQKQPKNDLSDIRGLSKLLKTPKQHKEPLNDLSDLKGVKNLMRTPKEIKPVKNDLTNVAGVKRLLGTPKIGTEPKNDLSDVYGLKKLMKTPKPRKSYVPDFSDVSGVGQLFGMAENDSDEVSVTSTSSINVKKAKARRGRGRPVEIEEEPIVKPKRTRNKKTELLAVEETIVPVKEHSTKMRQTNRKIMVPEIEEATLPSPNVVKTRKRAIKKQTEATATREVAEQIEEPVETKKRTARKRVVKELKEVPIYETETDQVDEVSSTMSAKGKTASRKRGINTKKPLQQIVEDDVEPVVKKARGRPNRKQKEDVVQQAEPSPKKTRGRRPKIAVLEEVDNTQGKGAKKSGYRKPKAKLVQNDEDDTVFTAIEEIDVKTPTKATRVTRTRRGRVGAAKQTEELHDVESTDSFTTDVVRKPRATKPASVKHVQFHADVQKSPAKTAPKRPKTRRLLSIDDIDEMSEDAEAVPVAPSTRKSARSRK